MPERPCEKDHVEEKTRDFTERDKNPSLPSTAIEHEM